jgi:formate-dependent phosphoribosylglycinamide formyltransferase (GAR transformylase)
MRQLSPLEYYVIQETMCGSEPFFVLLGAEVVKNSGTEFLVRTLVALIEGNLLRCERNGMAVTPTVEELLQHCSERERMGELLGEPSDLGAMYSFEASDAGIKLLKPQDQPR